MQVLDCVCLAENSSYMQKKYETRLQNESLLTSNIHKIAGQIVSMELQIMSQ